MKNNYLLTYIKETNSNYSYKTFEWFESESEMNLFISENKINTIIEKLLIGDSRCLEQLEKHKKPQKWQKIQEKSKNTLEFIKIIIQ